MATEGTVRDSWKHIARKERKVHETQKVEISPTLQKQPQGTLYILYDKKPLCVLDGELFAMYAIADPTLGYKLTTVDLDRNLVLANPLIISEGQALDILFLGKYPGKIDMLKNASKGRSRAV